MDKYQKLGLIAGQVLFGLGFGIAGALVSALFVTLYLELTRGSMDLYGEILFAVIGGYIGMQTGILFDGYKFLRNCGRRTDFIRFSLQSLLGLVFGFFCYYWLLPVLDLLAIALPLAGAIIGFDLGLIKGKKNFEKGERA